MPENRTLPILVLVVLIIFVEDYSLQSYSGLMATNVENETYSSKQSKQDVEPVFREKTHEYVHLLSLCFAQKIKSVI